MLNEKMGFEVKMTKKFKKSKFSTKNTTKDQKYESKPTKNEVKTMSHVAKWVSLKHKTSRVAFRCGCCTKTRVSIG